MYRVDSYISVDASRVREFLKSKDKSELQGNNILFSFEEYKQDEVKDFLVALIPDVNKIVVEKGVRTYFLVACQVEELVEEPFKKLTDVRSVFSDNAEEIASFMCKKDYSLPAL